jgi:hypothetical protein
MYMHTHTHTHTHAYAPTNTYAYSMGAVQGHGRGRWTVEESSPSMCVFARERAHASARQQGHACCDRRGSFISARAHLYCSALCMVSVLRRACAGKGSVSPALVLGD